MYEELIKQLRESLPGCLKYEITELSGRTHPRIEIVFKENITIGNRTVKPAELAEKVSGVLQSFFSPPKIVYVAGVAPKDVSDKSKLLVSDPYFVVIQPTLGGEKQVKQLQLFSLERLSELKRALLDMVKSFDVSEQSMSVSAPAASVLVPAASNPMPVASNPVPATSMMLVVGDRLSPSALAVAGSDERRRDAFFLLVKKVCDLLELHWGRVIDKQDIKNDSAWQITFQFAVGCMVACYKSDSDVAAKSATTSSAVANEPIIEISCLKRFVQQVVLGQLTYLFAQHGVTAGIEFSDKIIDLSTKSKKVVFKMEPFAEKRPVVDKSLPQEKNVWDYAKDDANWSKFMAELEDLSCTSTDKVTQVFYAAMQAAITKRIGIGTGGRILALEVPPSTDATGEAPSVVNQPTSVLGARGVGTHFGDSGTGSTGQQGQGSAPDSHQSDGKKAHCAIM